MNQSAFDQEAALYDERFTHSSIGKLQRKRVYHFLKKAGILKLPKKIFEINCGTGYDAEQLYNMGHRVIATDASEKMVEWAKKHRNKAIDFYPLSFEKVSENQDFIDSDLLFSNFGGLNCISASELQKLLLQITSKQEKGNQLAFIVMAKHCLWEDFYFWLKGEKSRLGRRNTNQALEVEVSGMNVPTYYHSPAELKSYLRDHYRVLSLKPIAFFLPPSYLESFFAKHKALLWLLNQMEKLFSRFEFLAKWSDHYLIIAEKK